MRGVTVARYRAQVTTHKRASLAHRPVDDLFAPSVHQRPVEVATTEVAAVHPPEAPKLDLRPTQVRLDARQRGFLRELEAAWVDSDLPGHVSASAVVRFALDELQTRRGSFETVHAIRQSR